MASDRAWSAALSRHEVAIQQFTDAVRAIGTGEWHARAGERRWSAAEEALHVAITYEVCSTTLASGAPMQPRVSATFALVSRLVVLPLILRTGRFPRGVAAPREVRPPRDAADASTTEEVVRRLSVASASAARALRSEAAARPAARLGHAYFGPITPYDALRLLTAHTGHHTRRLARPRAGGTEP